MGSALVVTPQTAWSHGSYDSVTMQGRFVLVGDVVNGAGESRYSALRVPGAAGGYQVTAGKTLYITKLRFSASSAPATSLILSGTADAGDSQIAAPAGVKSENSRADGVPAATPAATSNVFYEVDMYLAIAANRYPAIRNLTASSSLYALAVCHEE